MSEEGGFAQLRSASCVNEWRSWQVNISMQEGLGLDWHLGKVTDSELQVETKEASEFRSSLDLCTFLFSFTH